jgi:hypothetical protein
LLDAEKKYSLQQIFSESSPATSDPQGKENSDHRYSREFAMSAERTLTRDTDTANPPIIPAHLFKSEARVCFSSAILLLAQSGKIIIPSDADGRLLQ